MFKKTLEEFILKKMQQTPNADIHTRNQIFNILQRGVEEEMKKDREEKYKAIMKEIKHLQKKWFTY